MGLARVEISYPYPYPCKPAAKPVQFTTSTMTCQTLIREVKLASAAHEPCLWHKIVNMKTYNEKETFLLNNVWLIKLIKSNPQPVNGAITKNLECCVNLDVINSNPILQLSEDLLDCVVVSRQLE